MRNPSRMRPAGHRLNPKPLLAAAMLWLLSLAAIAADETSTTATSQSQVFKDWRLECQKSEGEEQEICQISQSIVFKEDNRPLLHMAVGYTAKEHKPAAIFNLPLGISLPPGVSVKIDEGEPRRMPIEHCFPAGCRAYLSLDEELLAALKRGLEAQVTFHDLTRRPVAVPVSLRGFTAGFNALGK